MSNSVYEPLWAQLKIDNKIKVKVLWEAMDISQKDKELKLTRLRRALSTRKEKDKQFYVDNPTAKIVLESMDFNAKDEAGKDCGYFVFKLTYVNGFITLGAL
jgi:hypothetical protein